MRFEFLQRNLIHPGFQRTPGALPDELPCYPNRQPHLGFKLPAGAYKLNRNLDRRVWNGARDARELAEEWPNDDALEAGRGRINAEDRPEQFVIRAGTPGVTVGASRLRCLSPCSQTACKHLVPFAEQFEIAIAFSNLIHR